MQKLWCIHANRSSRFLVMLMTKKLASRHRAVSRIDTKCKQVVAWSLHTFPENFMQIGPAVLPGYKTSQTTDTQTTDRRHSVPKARPIVRSAKNLTDQPGCTYLLKMLSSWVLSWHRNISAVIMTQRL